jgi:hypothetical protein
MTSRVRIGFSTCRSCLISRLIRWVTQSQVSHTWLLLKEGPLSVPVVLEAVMGQGFRLVPFRVFETGNTIVATIDPVVPIEDGVREALDWLGESYDLRGMFGEAVVMLGRRLHRRWHNPFFSSHTMFCSEAVVRTLQSAHYPGTSTLNAVSTSPQDLLDFLLGQM